MDKLTPYSPPVGLDEQAATRLAELFSTLSDARRVQIIAALLSGPMDVQTLAGIVGISESGVSHHLRGLRQMHLVRFSKQGRHVIYSIEDEHVADLFRRGLEHIQHG